MFFLLFMHYFLHFMTKKEVKRYFSIKKLISTSKLHAEHPFAGRNTQQTSVQRPTQHKSVGHFLEYLMDLFNISMLLNKSIIWCSLVGITASSQQKYNGISAIKRGKLKKWFDCPQMNPGYRPATHLSDSLHQWKVWLSNDH